MICETCGKEKEFIKEHHIQSKSLGGSDDSYNKAFICSDCHDRVHYGLIIIEGRFGSTKGNILIWRKFTEPSVTNLPDPPVWLKPNSDVLKEKYLRMKNLRSNINECYQ